MEPTGGQGVDEEDSEVSSAFDGIAAGGHAPAVQTPNR